jgi:hypothetical protein
MSTIVGAFVAERRTSQEDLTLSACSAPNGTRGDLVSRSDAQVALTLLQEEGSPQ